MKKMAIFVEGQTEQIFLEKLIFEIAGKENITIECRKASGGGRSGAPRVTEQIFLKKANGEERFYVLLFNCATDNRVASDIRDRYSKLTASGYERILGIRDVYPLGHSDIPKLRRGLKFGIPTKPVEVFYILGVMETESWFLAECSHYEKLDSNLSKENILASVSFDPWSVDIQTRLHPADDLHEIYKVAGLSYEKKRESVSRTVDILDYAYIYLHMGEMFEDLKVLNNVISNFLTSEPTVSGAVI